MCRLWVRLCRGCGQSSGGGVWGRVSDGGRGGGERANLGAFTSAPASMRQLTTRTLPPAEAAWSGRTPSRTELTGWPWERAYWTRPMSPEAEAEWRPRWGTAGRSAGQGRAGQRTGRTVRGDVVLALQTGPTRPGRHSPPRRAEQSQCNTIRLVSTLVILHSPPLSTVPRRRRPIARRRVRLLQPRPPRRRRNHNRRLSVSQPVSPCVPRPHGRRGPSRHEPRREPTVRQIHHYRPLRHIPPRCVVRKRNWPVRICWTEQIRSRT